MLSGATARADCDTAGLQHAMRRGGPIATLLEWDDRIPSFEFTSLLPSPPAAIETLPPCQIRSSGSWRARARTSSNVLKVREAQNP